MNLQRPRIVSGCISSIELCKMWVLPSVPVLGTGHVEVDRKFPSFMELELSQHLSTSSSPDTLQVHYYSLLMEGWLACACI